MLLRRGTALDRAFDPAGHASAALRAVWRRNNGRRCSPMLGARIALRNGKCDGDTAHRRLIAALGDVIANWLLHLHESPPVPVAAWRPMFAPAGPGLVALREVSRRLRTGLVLLGLDFR